MIEICVEIEETDESRMEMLNMDPDPQGSLIVFQSPREE